jgi:hypothetical protein
MGELESGVVYRYSTSRDPLLEIQDGLPNFHYVTAPPIGMPMPQLEKGISQIAVTVNKTSRDDGFPAILISSSVHNSGSASNPWHDSYEPDLGFVRYFGDAKSSGDPSQSPGNKILLSEFRRHTSGLRSEREKATPMFFFERTAVGNRHKGNVKFHGIGVIEKAELVTQFNPRIGYFTNYLFTFAILSLSEDGEKVDWSWINARRTGENGHSLSPQSWQEWTSKGHEVLPSIRRKVHRTSVEPPGSQLPQPGSREAQALDLIYRFYFGRKHRFELLASRVVMSYINRNGGKYLEGWVTRGTGDGGIDFVGRIELGAGFAAVPIVVLGQAKCESQQSPTGGIDIARTVARLKRGWIGAYVTTSYFSKPSQLEIREDEYPMIKINGLILSQEALALQALAGQQSLLQYLESLESEYPQMISGRRPEDILRP